MLYWHIWSVQESLHKCRVAPLLTRCCFTVPSNHKSQGSRGVTTVCLVYIRVVGDVIGGGSPVHNDTDSGRFENYRCRPSAETFHAALDSLDTSVSFRPDLTLGRHWGVRSLPDRGTITPHRSLSLFFLNLYVYMYLLLWWCHMIQNHENEHSPKTFLFSEDPISTQNYHNLYHNHKPEKFTRLVSQTLHLLSALSMTRHIYLTTDFSEILRSTASVVSIIAHFTQRKRFLPRKHDKIIATVHFLSRLVNGSVELLLICCKFTKKSQTQTDNPHVLLSLGWWFEDFPQAAGAHRLKKPW